MELKQKYTVRNADFESVRISLAFSLSLSGLCLTMKFHLANFTRMVIITKQYWNKQKWILIEKEDKLTITLTADYIAYDLEAPTYLAN